MTSNNDSHPHLKEKNSCKGPFREQKQQRAPANENMELKQRCH